MSVTLLLRVTGDKRKPGTKVPNSKEENLLSLINRLRTTYNQDVTGIREFLDELEKVVDVKAQLDTIRKGLKSSKLENEARNQDATCLHVVVDIFISLELKSPLRSGIVKILKEFKDPEVTTVVETISEEFKKRFSTCQNEIRTILHTANAVCGCFDNFPVGSEAIKVCFKEALTFLVESLTTCEQTLSAEASPVQNNEVCQCIHGLVRASLHVAGLEQSADFDMSQLHHLAKQLMACDQLPLDTRTNCGLLTVSTRRQAWIDLLQEQQHSLHDLTSLCLFSGIIGILSKEELTTTVRTNIEGKTPFEMIFDQIILIHMRNQLRPMVKLGVARALVALSRAMVACSSDQLQRVVPTLLSYTWEHLEHSMDSVKHLAVSLLHNIVKLHSSEVDVYGCMLRAMSRLPAWGRARNTALTALLGKVPAAKLISQQEIHLFLHNLHQDVVPSHSVSAFQELLRHHYDESADKEKWKELWILPLLSHIGRHPSIPLQQVLCKVLVICPGAVEYILKLPEGRISLATTLLCLRLAYKAGLLDTTGPDGPLWRGIISYDKLRSAIQQESSDQTYLLCLALIVDSPKKSEVFTTQELQLVVLYAYQTLGLEWEFAADWKLSLSLLGKFVSRFKASLHMLERRPGHAIARLVGQYRLCKEKLEACCIAHLFPGAIFTRRFSALRLLEALCPAATLQLRNALLASLADSYEDVKILAVKLLTTTPGLLGDFSMPARVLHVIDKGLQHAGGVKPPDCLSAAYLLAVLARTTLSEEVLTAVAEKYPTCEIVKYDSDIEHTTVYCLVMIAAEMLTAQADVAEVCLLKASSSGPLHGLLFTIRLLLNQICLKDCKSKLWKNLVVRLIFLCFKCGRAVASVVNNASPEGHFPMDFDFDPAAAIQSEDGDVEEVEGVEGVTSQMVLLCAWRTVKEVSLLLGYLADDCTISASDQEEGLLCEEDILMIGNYMTSLLTETKHRGAFEQAYVGFCKLVNRLWRLPGGKLQQLPLQWLQDTMKEIGTNDEALCATRRSAGIPFMIQALICTQMEVEGPQSVEKWVTRLLELAESPAASSTTHTHALNILRALFRSTQLGEVVSVCVERAFMVTISAFSAADFMERNSATLLLSALMTRVFGVPRTKCQESLGWKNKMTGRIFFQRYPKLFGFFQQQLERESNSLALYPVLLILGRLYPSSLEGTDSNIQLTQFIQRITECSGSNIYKTRVLAAQAMVALMTLDHFYHIVDLLADDANLPANRRHGLLLQVEYFLINSGLKNDPPFNKDIVGYYVAKLSSLFKRKLSCPELNVLFRVLCISCDKYFTLVPKNIWLNIQEYSTYLFNQNYYADDIGWCVLRPTIAELLLKLADTTTKLEMLCCHMLVDNMYEIRNVVLNFLDPSPAEKDHSNSFNESPKKTNRDVKDSCSVVKHFARVVLSMFENKCLHPEDKVKILSVFQSWDEVWRQILKSNAAEQKLLTQLLEMCQGAHDEMATSAMHCLIKCLQLKDDFILVWDLEDIRRICRMLGTFSASNTSYTFDIPLHKLLSEYLVVWQQVSDTSNKLQIYKLLVELSDPTEWHGLIDRIIKLENDNCLIATFLLGLGLNQFIPSRDDQSDISGKVFDKEEINSDYEEFILNQVCCLKFNDLCASNEHVLSDNLDPVLRAWLAKETGLDVISLQTFIAVAKLKVSELDPEDPCQFLNPGYQRQRLNCLRLKMITVIS